MHVAQFIQRYPPALGGSEVYARRLCEHLAAQGDGVSVWTSDALELSEMWKTKARPRPVSTTLAGRSSETSAPYLSSKQGGDEAARVGLCIRRYRPLRFAARRYVLKALSLVPHRFWQCLTAPCNPISLAMWRDANRYAGPLDAVHATGFPYSFPIACGLRLARRRGVPFLLTPFLHLGDPTDPHDRTRRQYTASHLRWLLNQADRVFVQTRAEGRATIELGVAKDRVILQGLGVEPGDCTGGDRAAMRAACGLVPEEVVIGHLANNSAEKGTVDLLRAAERAWSRGAEFRVLLAGPEMPNFRDFWAGFACKDRVTRLGVLSEEQKRDFFARIDAFALPSRCDSFGLVLLEAWASGKPNVVYRAGGPAEIVRHEIDGLQVACGDVEELAACLTRLTKDVALRRRLGEAGQVRLAVEFQWRDKLELVRDTMSELVARRAALQFRPSAPCQIAS